MADLQQRAAKRFVQEWMGRGDEKSDTSTFWRSLLQDVFGVHQTDYIKFEKRVKIKKTVKFIDAYIPETRILIEQKSLGIDLDKPGKQSDGRDATPFEQAKYYNDALPVDEHPLYIITCNFAEFWIYDMNTPNAEPQKVYLKDLETDYYRLQILAKKGAGHVTKEQEVSIKAGEIVGMIYDAFAKQYKDIESTQTHHSLNVLCVRLVFCLYAENAGIFGRYGMFHEYLKDIPTHQMRRALIDLFNILDTPDADRDPYLADDNPSLAEFPYVNGGLFTDKNVEIPPFTDEIRDLLLNKASDNFNWSEISPTIFGAVFESTLNPETRRSGGMHYTSIENIHKVIDPLFLDDLKKEYASVRGKPNKVKVDFQKKLSGLTFMDPACGSGNFLTETYISLRRIENDLLREMPIVQQGASLGGDFSPVKVSIKQFYGIEINDFAVSVAKTALWIAESQMLKETEDIVQVDLNFLPLKSYSNILEGNAVTMSWEDVIPKDELFYIMGNPPFVGARLMNEEQKDQLNAVFQGWKNAGNLDYVCCWYKKAADMMRGTTIRTALVSTNSITQGESVANLWKPLMESGVHIDFAHRTFRWDSEANLKAHVHCVIVGFSVAPNAKPKVIYTEDSQQTVKNINGYLVDADNIFVESRNKPLCDVPQIGIGNKPIDDGNYLFTEEERDEFLKREPDAEKYFRPFYGSYEFINRKPRYCLWLGDCPPNELRKMPECMKRVEAVKAFRLKSKSPGTIKLADTPTRFHVENMPTEHYLLIPRVSSENRKYVPIGFMSPDCLCSDSVHITPSATLYHFGVLTSSVHMAWMRAVCGRLEMRYRYSKEIVYNNFPWPKPTPEQRIKIEQTAQAILDTRELFPDSSLADLYDGTAMPPTLLKAHQENDRAVRAAYGWSKRYEDESVCVAELMKLYQELVSRS